MQNLISMFKTQPQSFSPSKCWTDFATGVCLENYKKMNLDAKFDTILKTVCAALFAGIITAFFISYYVAPFSGCAAGGAAFATATSNHGVRVDFQKSIKQAADYMKKKL